MCAHLTPYTTCQTPAARIAPHFASILSFMTFMHVYVCACNSLLMLNQTLFGQCIMLHEDSETRLCSTLLSHFVLSSLPPPHPFIHLTLPLHPLSLSLSCLAFIPLLPSHPSCLIPLSAHPFICFLLCQFSDFTGCLSGTVFAIKVDKTSLLKTQQATVSAGKLHQVPQIEMELAHLM